MAVSTLSLGAPDETDGRIARGARARTAIVDALLALIEAGELRPSAARIAERGAWSSIAIDLPVSPQRAIATTARTTRPLRTVTS